MQTLCLDIAGVLGLFASNNRWYLSYAIYTTRQLGGDEKNYRYNILFKENRKTGTGTGTRKCSQVPQVKNRKVGDEETRDEDDADDAYTISKGVRVCVCCYIFLAYYIYFFSSVRFKT